MSSTIILASQSPRRAEILASLGIKFIQQGFDIDENAQLGECAHDYIHRIAHAKCDIAQQRFPDDVVIVADTIVVINEEILMKPDSYDCYVGYMGKLSGRVHQVLTAIIVAQADQKEYCSVESQVEFAELDMPTIDAYWKSGEPKDKAGGYGIQGKGALLVKNIQGSFHAIMGLPVYETGVLLKKFGIKTLA